MVIHSHPSPAELSHRAIMSPSILELSGIGDPAILKPLNISVQVDLPAVGTNVQDHILDVTPICSVSIRTCYDTLTDQSQSSTRTNL